MVKKKKIPESKIGKPVCVVRGWNSGWGLGFQWEWLGGLWCYLLRSLIRGRVRITKDPKGLCQNCITSKGQISRMAPFLKVSQFQENFLWPSLHVEFSSSASEGIFFPLTFLLPLCFRTISVNRVLYAYCIVRWSGRPTALLRTFGDLRRENEYHGEGSDVSGMSLDIMMKPVRSPGPREGATTEEAVAYRGVFSDTHREQLTGGVKIHHH